jgi:hypothetical protein
MNYFTNVPFNGGKMNHIFVPERGNYKNEFTSEEAERCFKDLSTSVTLKVDGECACLVKTYDHSEYKFRWDFYRRRDNVKDIDPGTKQIPLFSGIQPDSFQKHNYSLVSLPKNHITGKGSNRSEPGHETYAAIQKGIDECIIPNPNDINCPNFITVEWVGRKHQANMDNVPHDHAIAVHGYTRVVLFGERTYENISQLATEMSIEGVIFESNKTGERFKLRFDMFPNSLWKQRYKLVCGKNKIAVTNEVTTIKPMIITPTEVLHLEPNIKKITDIYKRSKERVSANSKFQELLEQLNSEVGRRPDNFYNKLINILTYIGEEGAPDTETSINEVIARINRNRVVMDFEQNI